VFTRCIFVAATESTLPKLSGVQCTKLRHLTIVSLAIKNKVRYESYVYLIFSFILSLTRSSLMCWLPFNTLLAHCLHVAQGVNLVVVLKNLCRIRGMNTGQVISYP